jgi:hypothetical protein
MTQSNRDDLIAKVQALLAHGSGEHGSAEEEALAALKHADKLMKKHGLTLEDIGNHREGENVATKRSQSKGKFDEPAHRLCWDAISRFTGTKMWKGAKYSIDIFGFGGDVEMAHYLFQVVNGAMHRGFTDLLAKTPPSERTVTRHTMFWSYCRGFADTVNERIAELIRANEQSAEIVDGRNQSTELVVKKQAVVEHEFTLAHPELNLRKGRRTRRRTGHGDSYGQGRKDGKNVNFNRPVGSSNSRKALT